MKRYSAERKESVIQKMMPPHNIPIPQLVEETGISDVTLYNWRKQARVEGIAVPADGKNPEKWSSEDKFAIVLEAASLNEAELAEYCRRKGLYAEQIEAWRKACLQANADSATQAKALRGHRAHEDAGQVPADQRDLRAVPQDHPAGVLSGDVSQEALHQPGGTASRSR